MDGRQDVLNAALSGGPSESYQDSRIEGNTLFKEAHLEWRSQMEDLENPLNGRLLGIFGPLTGDNNRTGTLHVDFFESVDAKPHGVMNVPKIWKHSKDLNCFHLWTLPLRRKLRKHRSVQIVSKIE